MVTALDRRQFLAATSGLLLGRGLAQSSGRRAAAIGDDVPTLAPERWRDLAAALRGSLLLPGDPGFLPAARPWNLRFASILPAGIARCANAGDIRTCLLWAQTNGVGLVARSGGHSYAGYSTTTGLMIDLSRMNELAYDAGSGLARLGGGARNADVYAALRPVSRALTHGRCERVGVAGLALGGGIGFNQRLHGLTCDQLVETEIVTASGEFLRCNERENADLFWACRGGGGGNFGVNTALTFQTFPVDTVTVYQITWTTNLDALLPAALDLLAGAPDRLGCKLSVVNAGASISLEFLGQLVGAPTELRARFGPLYRLASPSEEIVQVLPYWDGQDFLSEEGAPEFSHERSRYILRPLSPEGARAVLEFLHRWPGTRGSAVWKIFLAGGAVAAVPAETTAFVHRAALMISSIELDWTEDDSVGTVAHNEAWLAEFHGSMAAFTSDESYQNFIDEAQNDYLHAYYGANLERLVEVKRRHDPRNVFSFPQSIPLSLGATSPRDRSQRSRPARR